LRMLDLSFNNINNLTPLSGLTDLSMLFLSDNDIRDISPLSNLDSFTLISLEDNPINVWTPVAHIYTVWGRPDAVAGGDNNDVRDNDVDLSDHVLIGIWLWDGNNDWTYVFFADGTGVRGLPETPAEFIWSTPEDDHLMFFNPIDDSIYESWSFIIEDDILTLTSRQEAGVTFNYIRE